MHPPLTHLSISRSGVSVLCHGELNFFGDNLVLVLNVQH